MISGNDDLPSISKWLSRAFPWVAGLALGAFLLFQCFLFVPPGQVGVSGGAEGQTGSVIPSGLHGQWPFGRGVQIVDVRAVSASAKVTAHLKDLQIVKFELHWQCSILKSGAARLVANYGRPEELIPKTVVPLVREAAEEVVASLTPEQFLASRGEFGARIKKRFLELLASAHPGDLAPPEVEIGEIAVVDLWFSDAFQKMMDRKLEAQNMAEVMAVEAAAVRRWPEILPLRAMEKWDGRLPLIFADREVFSSFFSTGPQAPPQP